jgi:lipopolysaccharide export LptBFGC system permease protein LptF
MAPFTSSDLLQAIPVVMGVVAAVPFSLLNARGKRRPLNVVWLVASLAVFVVAFGVATVHLWWAFGLTLAGMASSLALLTILLFAALDEERTRKKAGTRRQRS